MAEMLVTTDSGIIVETEILDPLPDWEVGDRVKEIHGRRRSGQVVAVKHQKVKVKWDRQTARQWMRPRKLEKAE